MFGYVRPLKKALPEEDAARYQAVYCGLCRTIGQRYGFVAQWFLNYDFAFLAMLLAKEQVGACVVCRRCPVYPWRKRQAWEQDEGLELAAAESVVLCYWKLKDSMQDSGFLKACLIWPLTLLLLPGYRRAAKHCAEFAATVQTCLEELRQMEEASLPSLDRPADAFARILQAASGVHGQEGQAALSQLLYHVGRWIYLVDAWDDLEEDRNCGGYNPILLKGYVDTAEGTAYVHDTMASSLAMAQSAFFWLETGVWSPVIDNILSLGLPAMQEAVLTGVWKTEKKRIIRRSNHE